MRNFLEFLGFTTSIIVGGLIFLFVLFSLIALLIIQFEKAPIDVYVDGEMIYRGPNIGAYIETAGPQTTVKVCGGYLYLFTKNVYVSDNVKVVPYEK